MKKYYIQATLEMILAGKDPAEVISGLKTALEAKGYIKLYPSVLRGVLRVLETKKDTTSVVVTVASEADLEKYKETISTTLKELTDTTDFTTHIDSTIIGGVVVSNSTTVLDKSFKSALLNLYRSITK